MNPVLIFRIRYNNSRSSVYVFSNGHYEFSIGGQFIFTVNNYLQHELAGITLDPVLKNLLMDSSQIIKILRTNRMHVLHEELRGVLSGEYPHAALDRGRRNDSCQTETPAMRRGKLAPSRHRRKGNFCGDGYLFEKTLFSHN